MKRNQERRSVIGRMIFRKIRLIDRVIRSKRDIEEQCYFYRAGTIPHAQGKHVPAVTGPGCPELKEAFQQIITRLRFLYHRPGHQVIGIHSVMPGEGKTFTAVNLATMLALSGEKVLLCEANLRKPCLVQQFGTGNETGLSTCLNGRSFEEVVQKTSIDQLWLLPAGPVPSNPAELLGSDRFRMLIDRSREAFDFVILDHAPASVVADSLITGPACDLNLFVLRAGVSRKDEFRFIDQLTGTGAMKHLVLVLNDLR